MKRTILSFAIPLLVAGTTQAGTNIVYSDDFTGQANGSAYNTTTSFFSQNNEVPVLTSYGSSINSRINVERL